ncbi:MAG: transglycosylase SLT domain-containing protein [Pseudomonadota bacterium]
MTTTQAIDAPIQITNAIRRVSEATGVNFDYLVQTARRESSLNPSAKAPTSSASGLFQFIKSTWLETVKEHGPDHGLENEAQKIRRTGDGRYEAVSRSAEREILDLRFNPKIASVMAGAFSQQNADDLSSRLGRSVTEGELYVAHFMGVSGANKLIRLAEQSPNADAVAAFPKEARSNRPIFRNPDGSSRTLAEVVGVLTRKHSDETVAVASSSNPSTADNEVPDQPFLNLLGFFRGRSEETLSSAASGFFQDIYREGDPALAASGERNFGALSFLFNRGRTEPSDEAPSYRVSAGDPIPSPASRPHLADQLVERWKASSEGGAPSKPLDLLAAQRAYQAR